jgi:hypothetical protein
VVENKGKSLEAVVEQVRDGSTVRVYLLPSFQFVQIYVAGVQVCLSYIVFISFRTYSPLEGKH